MPKTAQERTLPQIIISTDDHERLMRLSSAAARTMPDVASVLAEELDRAQVLPRDRWADAVVCMGSEVEFRDDMTGRIQTVTLVFPDEADIGQGRISILTPIGTALIGLAVGQSITWETRSGDERRLTVLGVRQATA